MPDRDAVIAVTTDQHVGSRPEILEHIVARAAAQHIIAMAAGQPVVTAIAVDDVVAAARLYRIVAIPARKCVCRWRAAHRIASGSAGQRDRRNNAAAGRKSVKIGGGELADLHIEQTGDIAVIAATARAIIIEAEQDIRTRLHQPHMPALQRIGDAVPIVTEQNHEIVEVDDIAACTDSEIAHRQLRFTEHAAIGQNDTVASAAQRQIDLAVTQIETEDIVATAKIDRRGKLIDDSRRGIAKDKPADNIDTVIAVPGQDRHGRSADIRIAISQTPGNRDHIIARAAIDLSAIAAVANDIRAIATDQNIIAVAALDHILTQPAFDTVVADAPVDTVIAVAAAQRVSANAAEQNIIAAQRIDGRGDGVGGVHFSRRCPGLRPRYRCSSARIEAGEIGGGQLADRDIAQSGDVAGVEFVEIVLRPVDVVADDDVSAVLHQLQMPAGKGVGGREDGVRRWIAQHSGNEMAEIETIAASTRCKIGNLHRNAQAVAVRIAEIKAEQDAIIAATQCQRHRCAKYDRTQLDNVISRAHVRI